jgi:hypothetical protein
MYFMKEQLEMNTLLHHIQDKTRHYGASLHFRAERAKKAGEVLPLRVKATGVAFAAQAQRIFRCERNMTTAALIETPLCIQPDQRYAVRIQLLGRDEPVSIEGTARGMPVAGLSALVRGEPVHIEVRAATPQADVAPLQQAEVCLPGSDYMAEVTLPMQPLSRSQRGRRERLHIYFMDRHHRPLYERPFVIELFISPLVQTGREGYHALPIPL